MSPIFSFRCLTTFNIIWIHIPYLYWQMNIWIHTCDDCSAQLRNIIFSMIYQITIKSISSFSLLGNFNLFWECTGYIFIKIVVTNDFMTCRSCFLGKLTLFHDNVMALSHHLHYWPFVQGIHQSLMVSRTKRQQLRTLRISLLLAHMRFRINS